jgi:sugar lactone lactonase YvrE
MPTEIVTIAGNGQKGYAGDGGKATLAQMNNTFGLTHGPDGALYVCDTDNHVIRKITPDGIISTVAGNGTRGYSGDGGPAIKAQLNEPYEVRFDKNAHLFFVERLNHIVRRVDAQTGMISTIAGTGKAGFSGDEGLAIEAQLREPHSLQFGADNTLYIADVLNHRVRVIYLQTGVITTLAGTGQKAPTPDGAKFKEVSLSGPRALDFDAKGNLWLALREGNAIYKFDMVAGTIHHIAGTGQKGFSGNGGPAKTATLSGPKGIALSPDGNIYFADTESHSIRMVDVKKGTLYLIAGTGDKGNGPDGDPLRCKLARPHGVWVDKDGQIFIGDSENHCVRVVREKK